MSRDHADSDPSINALNLVPEGLALSGRYRIERLIGYGGFAEIYEAEDELIGRMVAVKVLNVYALARDEDTLSTLLKRFHTEARAAALIDHPNIVTIFDMGVIEEQQLPYIVMEFLHGHDLATELEKRGGLDPTRALRLFDRCLDALALAHDQGTVHKDLKPANIFITHPHTDREDVRILDFGVARLQDQSAALTTAGEVLGTPQYLAPEYISSQTVTPALDVYQMALILVEMLTGLPVVNDPNPLACVVAHSSGDLSIDETIANGPLGPILVKALESKHTRRYANAGAFKTALDKIDPSELKVGGEKGLMKAFGLNYSGLRTQAVTPSAIRKDEGSEPNPIITHEEDEAIDLAVALKPDTTAEEPLDAEIDETERPDWLMDSLFFDATANTEDVAAPPEATDTSPEAIQTAIVERAEHIPPKSPDPPPKKDPTPIPKPQPEPRAQGPRPPKSPKSNKSVWLILAVMMLVVLVGVGIAMGGDGGDGELEPDVAPIPTVKAVQKARKPSKAVEDNRVTIGLITEPTAATIKDGKKVLGQAPMTLYLDPKRPRLKISIELEGHKPRSLVVTGKDAPMKVIKLKALR